MNIKLLSKEEYELLPEEYKNAIITDFAILSGGRYISEKVAQSEYDNSISSGYIGTYYIDSIENEARRKIAYHSYTQFGTNPFTKTDIGLRFVCDVPEDATITTDNNGNRIIYYGTYPKSIVDSNLNLLIENNGKVTEDTIPFYINSEPVELNIIEYNNKHYVKLDNYSLYSQEYTLVDGRTIDNNSQESLIIEIEPIMWIVLNDNKMINKDILAAGYAPYTLDENKVCKSNMDSFISSFEKDIFKVSNNKNKTVESTTEEISYDFDSEPTILDQMELALSLNQVVYLHGLPASGKSDRVFELDKDATVVYLASQDPSLLFGAEMLDKESLQDDNTVRSKLILTYWVKDIIKKATDDPDNIHVLFFDEFTNAHPQVQQLVLKLIDDRAIGEYNLPDNVRIILAGNEISDSSIAHTAVEPLKSRVSHIQVEITLSEWLEWAYDKGIHPYITGFLKNNPDYLRTQFDGNKPHCDPRRWAMASNVLYATGNPNSLVGLVDSDVLTKFIDFCKLSEDMTIDTFLKLDSILLNSSKYSYLASLVNQINDSDTLVKVIKKMDEIGLGSEEKDYLELAWVKGDLDRLDVVNFYDLNETIIEYNSDKTYKRVTTDKLNSSDLLNGYIESNTSVFLHGKPGIGKTYRVEEIDSDCQKVILSSTDKAGIVGSLYLDYDNNDIYQSKPSWLVKLEEKCAKEPDKIHVLFFDEFTNANPQIQGLVMNIVLYHKVGIGGWPLPDNARVIAAGNENTDSKAASKMAEPVYGRFGHIYYELNLEEWLAWGAQKNIHPLVLDFISNKELDTNNTNNTLSVLMPNIQDDQKVVNPRVWEKISDMLYKMEDDVKRGKKSSVNLRLLTSRLPDSILNSFIQFARNYSSLITVEGILNGKKYDLTGYTKPQLVMLTRGLLRVKPEHVDIIRQFIIDNIGNEALEIFDSLYRGNTNESELTKIK